ncbi:MAG: hypothetical protein N3D14_03740 [Aquificaceae bacterium]|nr:hypothetical protein [Aquificaceae bacterium]
MKVHAWLSEERKKEVLCRACSHRCPLEEGERGRCGARVSEEDRLYLTTYGLSLL